MNSTEIKTEKAVRNVQIFGFPSSIIDAMRGKEGWELVDNSINMETNPDYEIRFHGKKVLSFAGLHGFGFGSQAAYRPLRMSVIALLRTLIPNQIEYVTKHVMTGEDYTFDCKIYSNDYTA